MKLIVRFEDQSPSFTNGYEAGMIWQQMQDRKEIEMTVHSENMITLSDMAMAADYEIEFDPTDYDEWLYCNAFPVSKKPKPKKFKIIDGGLS